MNILHMLHIWILFLCFCSVSVTSADFQHISLLKETKYRDAAIPVNCDQFFFGNPFPLPNQNGTALVKLCQTQQHDGYIGPAVFATLFNVKDRIPVYTASVVILYPNCTGSTRPDSKFWSRVSLGLCELDAGDLPSHPISSRLGSVSLAPNAPCGRYQATNKDYEGNWKLIGVDRGHLDPNSINSQDQERQIATFTLTNAAPQFSKFNEISWNQYECIIKYIILKNVPMERVYVVTGTYGVALDENNNPMWMNGGAGDEKNPVKVPGSYWKAVCYPGNPWEKTDPWSFVVFQNNTNNGSDSTPDNILTVKEFSDQYFGTNIFGDRCVDVNSMGPIEQYFDDWVEHVNVNCISMNNQIQNGGGTRCDL